MAQTVSRDVPCLSMMKCFRNSSPLFQGRDKRPMRQEQRPSTAPGRLPVWRQRREHWQQKQRKKHRDQQLKLMRQQQKKQRQRQLEQEREQVPLSRLPEPRSPTRSSGTRSASASASPSARDRTSMPMLGREIDDAEAAEIVQVACTKSAIVWQHYQRLFAKTQPALNACLYVFARYGLFVKGYRSSICRASKYRLSSARAPASTDLTTPGGQATTISASTMASTLNRSNKAICIGRRSLSICAFE